MKVWKYQNIYFWKPRYGIVWDRKTFSERMGGSGTFLDSIYIFRPFPNPTLIPCLFILVLIFYAISKLPCERLGRVLLYMFLAAAMLVVSSFAFFINRFLTAFTFIHELFFYRGFIQQCLVTTPFMKKLVSWNGFTVKTT